MPMFDSMSSVSTDKPSRMSTFTASFKASVTDKIAVSVELPLLKQDRLGSRRMFWNSVTCF